MVLNYLKKKIDPDTSYHNWYYSYGAFYSYREQRTDTHVCNEERRVTNTVELDYAHVLPGNLGTFALGEYSNCRHVPPSDTPSDPDVPSATGDKGKGGWVICNNGNKTFPCNPRHSGSVDIPDYKCATTDSSDGGKLFGSYNKMATCDIY